MRATLISGSVRVLGSRMRLDAGLADAKTGHQAAAEWHDETRKAAKQAIARFARDYGAKYPKAVASLRRDESKLLAFFDFPAAHWLHLRTAAHRVPLIRTGAQFGDAAQAERQSAA